ncbi:uncharacterized protein LOC143287136 [Babylonia areolata]|uniref:uncharacterized protein LOC143287136 n=1 Tax=Babylonia areolata TaxID=304850 RepID=UPI003FD503DD
MSSVRQVVCIENVDKMTPSGLAKHLASMSCGPWQRIEVVFLYSKLQSRQPLCAAVNMSNLQYGLCMRWNNVKYNGAKLKFVQWVDCKKVPLARWILLDSGLRVSVKGCRHWAVDLDVEYVSSGEEDDDKGDDKTPVEAGSFYNWETIKTNGGERFCYVAFDCGCMIQERPLPGSRAGSDQLDLLVEKIVEAGVQRAILMGSSIKKAQRAKALAALYPDHFRFSVGYHPDVSGAWMEEKLATLRALASHPHCVAIGECGFDSTKTQGVHPNLQYDLLKTQVKLACELRKPLLIYENRAQDVVLEILRDFRDALPPVAVRSSSPDCDFDLYIQHGCYIVVTGWMFRQTEIRNSHFSNWLRTARPWQLDYLLLASGSPDTINLPRAADSVVGEYQRYLLNISKEQYTQKAHDWYGENKKTWKRTTPLTLPILIELVADTAGRSAVGLSRQCLENAQRFFQTVQKQSPENTGENKGKGERERGEEKETGWEKVVGGLCDLGWAVVGFCLPTALSLAGMYVVGYLRE